MNSKNVIPWVLVLIFAVMGFFLFNSGRTKEKELAMLRGEVAEISNLRSALDEAKKTAAQSAEVNLSENERKELIRLRSAVGTLRKETQDLSKVAQQSQQERDRLLQNQQAAAQQAQQLQQLQKQNQELTQQSAEQKVIKDRNQCINNLRQMDGAIQQWALENRQPANASVTMQNILPYISRDQVAPICPSAGIYTINNVSTAPTCSVTGHALAQ